jgi:cellulose biosynthesis protein BcsS
MKSVGGVFAAALLAAGCTLGGDPAQADELSGGVDFDRLLLFAGFDVWRSGASVHQGLLWSPGGMGREGFALKLLAAEGNYRYRTEGIRIKGQYALGSVMAGWRFKGDHSDVMVLIGPDQQCHALSPDDRNNHMRGLRSGVRINVDFWHQPTHHFMATASASASTIGENYWVRGAVGWHLFNFAWLGPEAMALGGERYSQVRFGAHVTGYRLGPFDFSAGAGYSHDSDSQSGLYARFGFLARRGDEMNRFRPF